MLLTGSVLAKSLELPDIQVVPIKDSAMQRNYELYIKLPQDYDKNADKHYPVLYYTDAMWHVELLSAATSFLMEDSILVGISWQTDIDEKLKSEEGKHVSRFRDYSVWGSSNAEHQTKYQFGQAASHLSFIRNDVFNYVDKTYRTDSNNRAYFGYSLGGLFGAFILVTQPDTFKHYLLGSPSVWRLAELESRASTQPRPMNANLFISYGSTEEKLGKHVDDFVHYLQNKKDKSLTIKQVVLEGSHQTAFPATGVRAVTWLSALQQDNHK